MPIRPASVAGFQKSATGVLGLFPVNAEDFPPARGPRQAQVNDAALHFEPESSEAMGFGFRCGFLGLLHMDIIQARLTASTTSI